MRTRARTSRPVSTSADAGAAIACGAALVRRDTVSVVARSRGNPEPAANRNQRVWAVVRAIPAGRVATYGQVADLAGITGPSGARQVGYALAALTHDSEIPWHRVVNARGTLSPRANPDSVEFQRLMLEEEGVGFDHRACIDLERYRWRPPA